MLIHDQASQCNERWFEVGETRGKSGFSRKQNRVSVDRGFCGRENEQQFISKKKLRRNTFQNIEKRTKT